MHDTAHEIDPLTDDVDPASKSRRPTLPRTILVDGFNVLHAVLLGKDRAEGWWQRQHRERLLEQLCGWHGGPDQIWVAFDGPQPSESVWAEPVAIVRAPSPPSATEPQRPASTAFDRVAPTIHAVFVESADDWIVRRARKAADPSRVIVVSADRKVAGRARSAGCEIQTPWTFMSACGPTDRRQDDAAGRGRRAGRDLAQGPDRGHTQALEAGDADI